ncbi:site-specific integrase [Paracoccaceae bacterium]|nr:site-specific integrase [Paracoccaceae bacterium]
MAQAKTLSKAELKQLLDVTNSCSRYAARDTTMLLFTHLCGLRIGEVAALRFDDILDANGAVRDEMTLDAARTKSKRARKIFLPKQMQGQLSAYTSSATKRPQHGHLFSTQKSSRFSANTATQHLQRLYARGGISGATSHSGRRTWLTALSQRGVSVFVLAEMAGHRSIQTTQRYVTVNDEMKRNAAELI